MSQPGQKWSVSVRLCPEMHRLLADHVTAEYRVRTEARGRVVDEWRLRDDKRLVHLP